MVKTAGLIIVAFVAFGCGSVEHATAPPTTVERHLVYEKIVGEKGIWIADVDGSRPRLLVPDAEQPVISPDGKWVAYGADCFLPGSSDCGKAYVVSTEPGEKPRLIAEGTGWTKTWTPDSKAIVVETDNALVRIDIASGEQATLARGQFWGWSLSPDGKQIVYARRHQLSSEHFGGETIDLFVAGADGSPDAKRITDTGDSAYPVWGPKSIAFAKLISYNGWGRHEIWRIQPDGTGRASITGSLAKRFLMRGCVGLVPVDWSDDGRALLAAWSCEFSDEPVAVDPETGEARQLPGGSHADALSSDGRFALVHAHCCAEPRPEEARVLIVPYPDEQPKVVAKGAVAPSWNR